MLKKLGAVALIAAAQSFAILGVGGHYVMNTGSVDGAVSSVYTDQATGLNVDLDQKKADGLSGFGVKLWVDVLPFVDVEATGNFQWTRYRALLNMTQGENTITTPIEMEFDGLPGLGKARPVFASITGDLSVTYPITFLPIIRPYVGGGVSYIASTPVLNKEFTQKFLQGAGASLLNPEAVGTDNSQTAEALSEALGEALADEGLNTGIGGHALVGFRVKPPIIPLAVYANTKYYFGGGFDSKFDPGFVFEIGAGFAL